MYEILRFFIVVTSSRKDRFAMNHTKTVMALNGKAFSSQIEKMSKKALKYNPEEVMIFKVDMPQEIFDFATDTARECLRKFKKEDEPSMAKHAADKFNEEYGENWISVVGDNYGVDVGHKGNFAHFNMGSKDFVFYMANTDFMNKDFVFRNNKEVAVGTCEMAPEMFQEAIKITKEVIALPTEKRRSLRDVVKRAPFQYSIPISDKT